MPEIFSHPALRGLITPILAGLVLSILAPFGTAGFSLSFRLVYWLGLTLAGGLGAMSARALCRKFLPKASILVRTGVQSLGATAAVAPFVISMFNENNILSIFLTLFYIWVVAIVITSVGELASRNAAPEPPAPTETRPALLDRLPPKFRDADLYAISSEDHYVRIHSAAGEHMLLMRLSDAEDLAAPLSGLKPHRSWWVAEAGVDSVSKSDGKLRITLKSGIVAPVSREGAKRVRDANWV
jgi:DNA-binding LytR/AlgR family response regulator